MKNFKKIRTTINILGGAVAVSFLSGLLDLDFSDDLFALIGVVIIILTTLLVIWVNKSEK